MKPLPGGNASYLPVTPNRACEISPVRTETTVPGKRQFKILSCKLFATPIYRDVGAGPVIRSENLLNIHCDAVFRAPGNSGLHRNAAGPAVAENVTSAEMKNGGRDAI